MLFICLLDHIAEGSEGSQTHYFVFKIPVLLPKVFELLFINHEGLNPRL